MEVIGKPDSDHLNGWASTFASIQFSNCVDKQIQQIACMKFKPVKFCFLLYLLSWQIGFKIVLWTYELQLWNIYLFFHEL